MCSNTTLTTTASTPCSINTSPSDGRTTPYLNMICRPMTSSIGPGMEPNFAEIRSNCNGLAPAGFRKPLPSNSRSSPAQQGDFSHRKRDAATKCMGKFCLPAYPYRDDSRRRIGFNREDEDNVVLHLRSDLARFNRRMNRLNKPFYSLAQLSQ